jgi:glutamine synthetase type III|tara:strand:+ start:74 stop:553 length:480 start_codon:yes stop_codon:yes gene_type:complete
LLRGTLIKIINTMEDIIQEKISADHLLYVSLKYTKTCDVIVNLILRWRKMIETSIDAILEKAKKKKKISAIPSNPTKKIEEIKKLFKKDKNFQNILKMYEMFRKIEELRKERSGEFRKNVNLKVFYQGKEININLEKLREYADELEKFISTTKQFLLQK